MSGDTDTSSSKFTLSATNWHQLAPSNLDQLIIIDLRVRENRVEGGRERERERERETLIYLPHTHTHTLSPPGKRIELKGFKGFLGGLDSERKLTGEYSVFTEFQNLEVMFHVAPLLPYTPNDSQQVSTNNSKCSSTSLSENL